MISIAVHPHHRRKGIGKELIEEAVQRFRLKKLWAEVRKSNGGAQSFYLKLGFKIVEEVPNYYGNEDALIFRWIPPRSQVKLCLLLMGRVSKHSTSEASAGLMPVLALSPAVPAYRKSGEVQRNIFSTPTKPEL